MFTGLIEEIGEVISVEPLGDGSDSLRLTIAGPLVTSDATYGASIAVSGVCLTVVELGETAGAEETEGFARGTFSADVMGQSIRVSAIGDLQPGSRVNLERAAHLDTRLGGHIVQGHVDSTATLVSATPHEDWRVLRFALDPDLAPLIVDKGSVTLSGVSLTVSGISPASEPEQWFEVSLIPETLTATTLGSLEPGDRVNVETDIVARHVARMLQFGIGAPSASGPEHPIDLTSDTHTSLSTPTEGAQR